MPTPAYIDTDLYLPLGGVNGFELNGFAINGVGFVDSPFAGGEFELDPYRSILQMDRFNVGLLPIYPSALAAELDLSVQVASEGPSEVWAPRCSANVISEGMDSSVGAEVLSLALEVDTVSFVPTEYRTAYVVATHPASLPCTTNDSDVDEVPPSTTPDEVDVSVVPTEYRSVTVQRGDS